MVSQGNSQKRFSFSFPFFSRVKADLSQQGELLLQDSFQVWTESKKDLRLRLKTQHRHIFLYQKAMLFCKQGSKTGHNKSTYQFKHWLQVPAFRHRWV